MTDVSMKPYLCFTVSIKYFMVCQPLKVFSIEEIKEKLKFIFFNKNLKNAVHFKIGDGFDLVIFV